jgi:hypothetical protein
MDWGFEPPESLCLLVGLISLFSRHFQTLLFGADFCASSRWVLTFGAAKDIPGGKHFSF